VLSVEGSLTGFTILIAVCHQDVAVITKLSCGPLLPFLVFNVEEEALARTMPSRTEKPINRLAGIALE